MRISDVALAIIAIASAYLIFCAMNEIKAWSTRRLIANAWRRQMNGEFEVRPWPWASAWPVARIHVHETDADVYVLASSQGGSTQYLYACETGKLALQTRISLQTLDGKVKTFQLASYVDV